MSYKNKEKQREYSKRWRQRNKDVYKVGYLRRKLALKNWLIDYKSTLKCNQCGFSKHHAAIDFHHRDPALKSFSISKISKNIVSKEKLLKEIEKCDILCSNCHRILHYQESLQDHKEE